MRVINILIFLFALLAAFQTLRLFARNRSAIRSTVLWTLIWIVIGVLGLFPVLIDMFMVGIQMRNRMFFLFMMAILILFAMLFQQSTRMEDLKRQISRVAQELALLRFDRENGQSTRVDGNNED